jgi:glutathione S-transferase
MPTLYYSPGSAAMAPHAAFLEAGAPLEIVKIERENGVITSPANYLDLNPHGRVPALVDGSLHLHESAAIVLHVADRHPQSGLLPAAGSDERSEATRWLVHLTNTVQPQFIAMFGPARMVGAGASQELLDQVKAGAQDVLAQQWDWLDGELDGKHYLLGDTFSAADLYLFMLTRWGRTLTPKTWDRPNIAAHYARLAARPSVARMLEQQGIEAYPA